MKLEDIFSNILNEITASAKTFESKIKETMVAINEEVSKSNLEANEIKKNHVGNNKVYSKEEIERLSYLNHKTEILIKLSRDLRDGFYNTEQTGLKIKNQLGEKDGDISSQEV